MEHKNRYRWWGYIKAVCRAYPAHKKELDALRQQAITPRYNAEPGAGGASRTTEAIATRMLPPTDQRELDAVEAAIKEARGKPNGALRVKLASLVFFQQSHTLHGAADKCRVSYATARRWHADFVMSVAHHFGLL